MDTPFMYLIRTYQKTEEIVKYSDKIIGYKTIEDLVSSTKTRRFVLLEVSAGKPVDDILENLEFLLDPRDIVIDCGNSDFNDTIRREKNINFNYVGMGVSGGEDGARFGPYMMIGCKKAVFNVISPILESISAKHNNIPCCVWMGENGAGHFVKTVHNGIEYVIMQLFKEIYNIGLRGNKSVLTVFEEFGKGRMKGFLEECSVKVLRKQNSNGFIIDQILDKALQKGTGKMCINSTLELGVENNSMSESVFSRFLSSRKEDRLNFLKLVEDEQINVIGYPSYDVIEKSVYLCKAVAFIQGFNLLFAQKRKMNWNYAINDLCDAWSNGCIIRCEFLDLVRGIDANSISFLEGSDVFLNIYKECYPSLKKLCSFTTENQVYAPVFNIILMWLNEMKMGVKNGVLVQALRDYFGRHGVVVNDEFTNIDWDNN